MAELPNYLSPSSAASFEGCPRRWEYKYVQRLPEPSHQAALVGSFAHAVLEDLCELAPEQRTQDEAKKVAKKLWPEFTEDEDYISLELDEDSARGFRWQAWLAIAGLWDLEDPALVNVVSTEQKITTSLDEVPFVGIIDRVDRTEGKLVVSDYKSGTLPGSRWRDDKIQQIMLYAAALESSVGEQPERARLLYLGQQILDVNVTPDRLADATGQLATTWDSVKDACETEEFEAKPSVLCGWCPFVTLCEPGRDEILSRHEKGNFPSHAPSLALVTASSS